MSVKENLENLRLRVDAAAKKSGRVLQDVTLVAVTKGAAKEALLEAYEAGLRIFAENKVQEALVKIAEFQGKEIEWQMIGHLQSNKVKTATEIFSLIQSVDSVRLAEKISRECEAAGKVFPVLLEVNISGEEQKYGFKPEEVYSAIDEIKDLESVRVLGLMGMAPLSTDPALRRAAFKNLKNIFSVCQTLKQERLEMKYLSMGMSDDYECAVEEGSNMIRIGRALFGGRK